MWRAFFTLASASALQLHAQPLYRPPTRYSTVRLAASWEEVDGGCQLLRPEGKPRALIHFLGGVFVSPEPQVAYASLLESLAARGYVVVATPFAVDFDYRKPADEVYAKFGAAKVALGEYSSLPQLAMGHSLGALLQVLLGCWYPEYADACAGAALLSFNNKPVKEAIPAFEELFVPALAPIEPVTRDPVFGVEGSLFTQLKDLRRTGFSLAREVARLNPLNAPATLREPLESAIDNAEAIASLGDQLPEVFASVSRGTSEFRPTPVEVRAMLGEYSQRQPLLVSFSVDSLDETDDLEQGIPVAIDAKRTRLTGTHLTPLAVRRPPPPRSNVTRTYAQPRLLRTISNHRTASHRLPRADPRARRAAADSIRVLRGGHRTAGDIGGHEHGRGRGGGGGGGKGGRRGGGGGGGQGGQGGRRGCGGGADGGHATRRADGCVDRRCDDARGAGWSGGVRCGR